MDVSVRRESGPGPAMQNVRTLAPNGNADGLFVNPRDAG
jgi:hypothetical protein